MKTFAVVSLVAVLASSAWGLSDELKKEIGTHAGVCIKEAAVEQDALNASIDKNFEEPSEQVKCFVKCITEKIGLFDDNGLNLDSARKHLSKHHPADKVEKLIETCKDASGEDACATAFNIVKCYEANRD